MMTIVVKNNNMQNNDINHNNVNYSDDDAWWMMIMWHSLTHSFTHSPTASASHPGTHSLTHTLSHPLAHSLPRSLIHSRTPFSKTIQFFTKWRSFPFMDRPSLVILSGPCIFLLVVRAPSALLPCEARLAVASGSVSIVWASSTWSGLSVMGARGRPEPRHGSLSQRTLAVRRHVPWAPLHPVWPLCHVYRTNTKTSTNTSTIRALCGHGFIPSLPQ